jgi:hypothetical protein
LNRAFTGWCLPGADAVLGAHVAQGIALEQADRDPDGRRVDLERVRRLVQALEAEARVTARVVAVVELRGVERDYAEL